MWHLSSFSSPNTLPRIHLHQIRWSSTFENQKAMIQVQSSRPQTLPVDKGHHDWEPKTADMGVERQVEEIRTGTQNIPLCHEDYFEPKAIEKKQAQDQLSAVPHLPGNWSSIPLVKVPASIHFPYREGNDNLSTRDELALSLHTPYGLVLLYCLFPHIFAFLQFAASRISKSLSFVLSLLFKFILFFSKWYKSLQA